MARKMLSTWRGTVYLWALIISTDLIATPQTNQLVDVSFELDKQKRAVVVVELSHVGSVVDISAESQGIKIVVKQTQIASDKLAILDVTDFSTAVNQIELFDDSPDVRIFVETAMAVQYQYTMHGKQLKVTILPLSQQQSDEQKLFGSHSGKLTSINFQDIPVRSVLQLLADYNHFNLVASDSVQGNLTLRLDGVPWTEVLDIILRVKGLDKRVKGNIIMVAPKTELDLQERQALEKSRLAEQIGQLKSEIININYAKAADVAAMIGGDSDVSMLSERGSVAIDERTNALLVRELPENLRVIKEIIASLDIPVKQVQIEARVVTIKEGNIEELGIRWGYTSINGDTTIGSTIEGNLASSGIGGGEVDIDDFLNVNLGALSDNAASIAFQVASLGSNTLLDLELSALQSESKAEIISSPRLITTNKKSAYIEQGTEIPYLKSTSSGATAVEFKKAVLSLTVTPQITPDNRLRCDSRQGW